jgi:hypothetical protein
MVPADGVARESQQGGHHNCGGGKSKLQLAESRLDVFTPRPELQINAESR